MAWFCHVSGLIELDEESWTPAPAAYLDTAAYFPRRSRRLLHESIHYWHQLAHGYLLALADEDYRRLLAWEGGAAPADGPIRARHTAAEGRDGLSPDALCECLARFWELALVGADVVLKDAAAQARKRSLEGRAARELDELARAAPSDHAFDVAMQLSGNYAVPYAVVRRRLDPRMGLLVFPFLVHFALKTERPVPAFERLVAEVAPAAATRAAEIGAERDVAACTSLFEFIAEHCQVALAQDGLVMRHARTAFAGSALADHPVYRWSFERFDALAVHGLEVVDLAICLPSLSELRTVLGLGLTPPCLRFRDRRAVALAHEYASRRKNPAIAAEAGAAAAAAAACLSLQDRWDTFQTARSGR